MIEELAKETLAVLEVCSRREHVQVPHLIDLTGRRDRALRILGHKFQEAQVARERDFTAGVVPGSGLAVGAASGFEQVGRDGDGHLALRCRGYRYHTLSVASGVPKYVTVHHRPVQDCGRLARAGPFDGVGYVGAESPSGIVQYLFTVDVGRGPHYTSHMSRRMLLPECGRYIVYLFHHPDSPYLYVGKSSQGRGRLLAYEQPSQIRREEENPRPVTRWIKSLRKRGLCPEVAVLEECTCAEELDEAEQFHIAHLRASGEKLLNLTPGGDGAPNLTWDEQERLAISVTGCAAWTAQERRAAMSQKMKRLWQDPAYREAALAPRGGKPLNPEHREKIAAGLRGRKRPPEVIAKVASKKRGQKASPETRAKMSATRRARAASLDTGGRAQMTAAAVAKVRGAPKSVVHREKIAASLRGRVNWNAINAMAKANRGRSLQAEHKEKISQAKRGSNLSNDYERDLSEAKRGPKLGDAQESCDAPRWR